MGHFKVVLVIFKIKLKKTFLQFSTNTKLKPMSKQVLLALVAVVIILGIDQAQAAACSETSNEYSTTVCNLLSCVAGDNWQYCKKKCGCCDNDDWSDQCGGWASSGECDANPDWMKENCAASCEVCESY